MKFKIKHRFTGKILFEAETESLKLAIELAVKSRANLAGAYLAGAYLAGANLAGAYLARANLTGAYLDGAYLAGAYLDGAYLAGANLDGANLARANLDGANLDGAYLNKVKIPPINSHQFTSEILWHKAKTESQKNFSARVRLETNKCWKDFYILADKMKVKTWVKKVLSHWWEYKEMIKSIENAK